MAAPNPGELVDVFIRFVDYANVFFKENPLEATFLFHFTEGGDDYTCNRGTIKDDFMVALKKEWGMDI